MKEHLVGAVWPKLFCALRISLLLSLKQQDVTVDEMKIMMMRCLIFLPVLLVSLSPESGYAEMVTTFTCNINVFFEYLVGEMSS